jgi:hypothetical protein
MQFTIPQFIDVEAKIIGPITVRQFIIILAGFFLGALSYKIFDFSLFLTVAVIIFIIIIMFGFAKIHGRPFHYFVINFIQTLKKARLRIWNNTLVMASKEEEEVKKVLEIYQAPPKQYSVSRLAELSLMVDTGGAYRGESGESKSEIKRE